MKTRRYGGRGSGWRQPARWVGLLLLAFCLGLAVFLAGGVYVEQCQWIATAISLAACLAVARSRYPDPVQNPWPVVLDAAQ